MYTFSCGQIKSSNRRYTSIKHDYCITLDSSAVYAKCEDDIEIRRDSFTFNLIKEIEQLPPNQRVDVIGITLEVSQPSLVNLRDGT